MSAAHRYILACQPLMFVKYFTLHFNALNQGLQTTAHEPNPTCDAVSSDPRKHFATDEKIYCIYEKLVDLVKYNISRNRHIT